MEVQAASGKLKVNSITGVIVRSTRFNALLAAFHLPLSILTSSYRLVPILVVKIHILELKTARLICTLLFVNIYIS